jgi:quercetin dioxygenase-like cupin family protein
MKRIPGEGTSQRLWFLDAVVSFPIVHSDGKDGISMFEAAAPHGFAPPPHLHRAEDEAFYVLEGEFRWQVGDAEFRLGAGETVLAPAGVPHSFRIESRGGARWLNVTTHGDFERFVRALGRPAERDEMPPLHGDLSPEQREALVLLGRQHGIEFIGVPLDPPPA